MIDFDSLALAPCIAAFGVPAVYQPGAGPAVQLQGIFNEFATDQKIMGDGEARQVNTPTFAIRLADLTPGAPLPCRNEALLVNGITWQIAEALPDSFGQLLLKLRRAQ